MRITVENARALSKALTDAAASAQAAGKPDFDLLDTLGAVDDDARMQLAAAIAAADSTAVDTGSETP